MGKGESDGDRPADEYALARGYRYYKAMEHMRRGYVVIRDSINDFLHRRYWGVRRQDLPQLALELTDLLMAMGGLAVYQAGVNEENWREQQEREKRRAKEAIDDGVRAKIGETVEHLEREHERKLAEIESERSNERYVQEMLRQRDLAERDAAETETREKQKQWRRKGQKK